MSTLQRSLLRSLSSPLAITALYYSSFIGLGMSASVIGPTLLGLTEQTHTSLSQISLLFTASSLGYLLGALAVGRLYDRRTGHPVMVVAMLLIAALLALVPAVPQLAVLLVVVLLLGAAQAGLDVGSNTLLVWLHRERVSPFMNGLHLFWGLGSALAPALIAQAILITGGFDWGYRLIAILLLPVAVLLSRAPSPGAPHKEPGAPRAAGHQLAAGGALRSVLPDFCRRRRRLRRLDFHLRRRHADRHAGHGCLPHFCILGSAHPQPVGFGPTGAALPPTHSSDRRPDRLPGWPGAGCVGRRFAAGDLAGYCDIRRLDCHPLPGHTLICRRSGYRYRPVHQPDVRRRQPGRHADPLADRAVLRAGWAAVGDGDYAGGYDDLRRSSLFC